MPLYWGKHSNIGARNSNVRDYIITDRIEKVDHCLKACNFTVQFKNIRFLRI